MDMIYCSTCGYEYNRMAGDCPACAEPEKYFFVWQIEKLAKEYGKGSAFAKSLRTIAARINGKQTSERKAGTSRENGKSPVKPGSNPRGRPKKTEQ